MGIQQSIASLAFTIPPLIAGVLVSFDVRLPLVAAAVVTLLAWVNFYFRFEDKKIEAVVEKD